MITGIATIRRPTVSILQTVQPRLNGATAGDWSRTCRRVLNRLTVTVDVRLRSMFDLATRLPRFTTAFSRGVP